MTPAILRGTLKGARAGVLIGLGLAALYLVVLFAGSTELNKSVGYSLLLIGFPMIFVVEAFLQSLGIQGGKTEAIAVVVSSLPLNGALWGAAVGSVIALVSSVRRRWIRSQPGS